jgi:hypothetical protein
LNSAEEFIAKNEAVFMTAGQEKTQLLAQLNDMERNIIQLAAVNQSLRE